MLDLSSRFDWANLALQTETVYRRVLQEREQGDW
jgi:hypothetical protein